MLVPFFRTLILYIAIMAAVRLMGKRQVGELQPGELVSTILISAVASVPMQDIDIPLAHGLVPILTLISAEILVSALSLKSIGIRRLITGSPMVVIKNGIPDEAALKKLRLTLDDLMEDLRLKDVFDIRTVKTARIETNGQMSVMLDGRYSPLTVQDAGIAEPKTEELLVLVQDGAVIYENLDLLGRDEAWLISALKAAGAASAEEVFLFCSGNRGSSVFVRKRK